MSLYDTYEDILSDNSRWNATRNENIEHDFPNVLVHPHAYNFLLENLFYDGNLRPLSLELNRFREKIPKERFSHTVSLYLFGISVAEVIGFKQFKLPEWDKAARRNFLHHWSGVCMSHDIGYALEDNPSSFGLEGCASIDSLNKKLKLKHDLTKGSATDLIKKYYAYRSQTMCKINHGVVGAMLLYNALMKRDAEMQGMADDGCIIISEKPMYGNKYRADIKRYALDIARHNMWFADAKHTDTYNKYGLVELIPHPDNSHRISFAKSPMLFLLCLLDTVEPIKTNSDKCKIPEDILKDCTMKMEKQGNRIKILFGNEIMRKKAKSCEAWLDINVNDNSAIEFSI